MFTNHIYLNYTYKSDPALNNLQWLICHKTTSNQTKSLKANTKITKKPHLNWGNT